MKITDVTLTLFAWDDIPVTSYGGHTGQFSGASRLGLLAIHTDRNVTGHAFLGSAFYPADMDGATLVRYLKPILLGQDPFERERLSKAMWKRVRTTTVRAIGAVDVALWDIAGKAADLPIASRPTSARPCWQNRKPMPTRRCTIVRSSSRPTRFIRRKPGARTSRFAKPCARQSVMSTG
jgi:L-alanine-DL-glutamate epimerase-like enolase superfamily enzyme